MGGGAVDVQFGELAREDDAVAHIRPAEVLGGEPFGRDHGAGAHHCAVGEVGEDPQEHSAAAQLLDERADRLAHRVDEVGAHRIAAVDHEVDDEKLAVAGARAAQVHLDVQRAAAARHHVRVCAVGQVEDALPAVQDSLAGGIRIGDIEHLDLPDDERGVGGAREAARLAYEEGCRAHRGDDRRLLDDHRYEVVPAVDREVETEAHRHREDADDVLGQPVGLHRGENVRSGAERLVVALGQDAPVAQFAEAFLDAQLVEPRDAGACHAAASILTPSGL